MLSFFFIVLINSLKLQFNLPVFLFSVVSHSCLIVLRDMNCARKEAWTLKDRNLLWRDTFAIIRAKKPQDLLNKI